MHKVSKEHTTSGRWASLLGSGLKHLTARSKQSSSLMTLSCSYALTDSIPDLL